MRKTPNTTKVLRTLLDTQPTYGRAITDALGLHDETVYRILAAMQRDGWVTVRRDGRKRVYALTDLGMSWARAWSMPNPAEVARYRRQVTVVRAVKWTGDNLAAVMAFAGEHLTYADGVLTCRTLHGPDVVAIGDWLVEGAADDVYPIKPEPFATVYEPAD